MLQQLLSKNKKYFLILFLLVFPVGKANAQSVIRAFTISPPAVEVKLDPGGKAEGKLKIINDSSDTVTFGTSTQDFIVKDNVGTPDILPPDTLSNKYSGAKWIAIYPSSVTVNAHKSQEVNYYIQVPADARPGGRYAALVYTPITTIDVKGTGAAVQTSVGTLFYITVNGPVTESAQVSGFNVPNFLESAPVKVKTQITNNSDIHIAPDAKITLTNFFGGKSAEANLPKYNVFPGAARNYENSLGSGFMFGPYKVSLAGTYGTAGLPLTAAATLWIIPWRLILFILLLIIVALLGSWYLRKRNTPPPSSL